MPLDLNIAHAAGYSHGKRKAMGIFHYLWILEVVDQFLNCQIVGQHLKGLWPVLGQRVVHVKSDALQQPGISSSARSIALPHKLDVKLSWQT